MDIKWIVAALALVAGAVLFLTMQSATEFENTLIFASGGANQVSVINLKNGKIDRIDAGPVVHGVSTLPDGSKAYATTLGAEELSIIDLKTKDRIGTLPLGTTSHHLEVSPDGKWLYATLGSEAAVAVVNTSTDTLAQRITVAEGPSITVFSPDGREAYVTSRQANIVTVIDTVEMEPLAEISVDSPDHAAISPDGERLFVTSRGSNQLFVVDLLEREVSAAIAVGEAPHGVAVAQSESQLLVFVGNRGETTLSVVDAENASVIRTIDLKVKSEHLITSPDGKTIYIGSVPGEILMLLDVGTLEITKRFNVRGEIHQIAVVEDAIAANFELVPSDAGVFRNINAEQLQAVLDTKDFFLANVHIPYEGELPETDAFIPYNMIEHHLDELPPSKSDLIALYCRSGSMSAQAAETLVGLGYTNVWNLKQGMQSWERLGYPLIMKGDAS